MEKVAQLVKLAKDKYLSDNERLGTVGSATRTGAHTGARVGGVVGALRGAAVGALKGASHHNGKIMKSLGALGGAATGALVGGGGGALVGGAAGGALGSAAGAVRAGKRALYGQESVSKVEHNTRKMLSKSAEDNSRLKKVKSMAEALGGTAVALGGVRLGERMNAVGHNLKRMHDYDLADATWHRDLEGIKSATSGIRKAKLRIAGSKLLAGASALAGAGLVAKSVNTLRKK